MRTAVFNIIIQKLMYLLISASLSSSVSGEALMLANELIILIRVTDLKKMTVFHFFTYCRVSYSAIFHFNFIHLHMGSIVLTASCGHHILLLILKISIKRSMTPNSFRSIPVENRFASACDIFSFRTFSCRQKFKAPFVTSFISISIYFQGKLCKQTAKMKFVFNFEMSMCFHDPPYVVRNRTESFIEVF